MKQFVFFLVFLLLFLQSCDSRQREQALDRREALLNQREQELSLKETSLQLREDELAKKKQEADSTAVRDSSVYNAAITGNWEVRMTCTETSCPGSAVGDTKTETWEIAYQENNVVAKAFTNNQLARVYSGVFTGNTLELVETLDSTNNQPATRMVVRLRLSSDNLMEGQREIERIGQCKIIYETVLNKKVPKP
jgi:hypothetical protein